MSFGQHFKHDFKDNCGKSWNSLWGKMRSCYTKVGICNGTLFMINCWHALVCTKYRFDIKVRQRSIKHLSLQDLVIDWCIWMIESLYINSIIYGSGKATEGQTMNHTYPGAEIPVNYQCSGLGKWGWLRSKWFNILTFILGCMLIIWKCNSYMLSTCILVIRNFMYF
jgi:hypothetical protein